MATMVNFMKMQWVMTNTSPKGICCVNTQANIKLLAKRLQVDGNQGYEETFSFKRINSPKTEFTTLPVTDYEIDDDHCYIKFGQINFGIGMVEILGMEQ